MCTHVTKIGKTECAKIDIKIALNMFASNDLLHFSRSGKN